MKNEGLVLGALILGIGGFLYWRSKQPQPTQANAAVIVPTYSFDPAFNQGYHAYRVEYTSTDNVGGTLDTTETLVTAPANYPTFTGGTFIHPENLPPVRQYNIQTGVVSPPTQFIPEMRRLTGGKFVNPSILPPTREYGIQRGGPMRRTGLDRRREEE